MTTQRQPASGGTRKTVLITGASTGVGRALTRTLLARGWYVMAGVLPEQDDAGLADELGDAGQIVPLDVTDEKAIAKAASSVTRLDALVHCAAVVVASPLEYVPVDEIRRHLEVNAVGPIALTQALAPALRETKGRAVFIGSSSCRVASPLMGAYAASKFALTALTDVLRAELLPAGIGVSLIEPGLIKSELAETSRQTTLERFRSLPEVAQTRYGRLLESFQQRARDADAKGRRQEPQAVADVVIEALTVPRPKPRYLVGTDAKTQAIFASYPARLRAKIMGDFVMAAAKSQGAPRGKRGQ